jgi:hypothetical protein
LDIVIPGFVPTVAEPLLVLIAPAEKLARTVAEPVFQELVHPELLDRTDTDLVPVEEVETVQPLPEEEVQPSHWYPEPPEAVNVSVAFWQTGPLVEMEGVEGYPMMEAEFEAVVLQVTPSVIEARPDTE